MDLSLADYRVTQRLRESGHSRTYGAVAVKDGREVVAKVVDIDDPAVEARVQHEFELIRSLDIEGVVRAESLQRVGDQLVLILERAPGTDLRELVEAGPVALGLFFEIAIQIADILAQTHGQAVVHRDIKPANVLFDADSGRVHVADFGISVLLERERRHLYDDLVLIGTLPYISPEQTGRTNRSVDFRSDLYSLGVTFFELLTGARPFAFEAPLELIHAHLARTPPEPRALRPELPQALSKLVVKLMAKAPERRYQTATGLGADLRALQRQFEAGVEDASFLLGGKDRSTTLRLSHQLHGRARELAELHALLAQLQESGERRVCLLAGPTGVGKSALLESLEVAAVGHGGLVLRGEFDPHRELPYSGFVTAMTAVFEQLLTESEVRLTRWRRRITRGLGGLTGVVCELVPTLELIVGEQPPVAELGPIEARNRLQLALERLMASLCELGLVVVILDDIQFADHASVALLDVLSQGAGGPLLITGTVRDEALPEASPLAALLDALEDPGGSRGEVMRVGPLEVSGVEALLGETLGGGAAAGLAELAAVVTRKTGGVALFVGQFLTRLAEEGVLRPSEEGWAWSLEEIEAAQIPDDAVTMMGGRLGELSEQARTLSGGAACLGGRFELSELMQVSELGPGAVISSANELLEAGLLATVGSALQFAHGSIQTAARGLLGPDETRSVHWRIGEHMLEVLDSEGLDQRLFELVDHLIAGTPPGLGEARRVERARLSLRAGRRALDAAAYDLAGRYFGDGLELLGEALDHDTLEFELSFGRAQALSLERPGAEGRDAADEAFAALLTRELSDGELGRVVGLRVRLLHLDNRSTEAVALGRAALARLGAPIPAKVSVVRSLVEVTLAWLTARKLDRDSAMAIPKVEDERGAAIVEIVAKLKYPAFVVENDLFVYLSGRHVRLLREQGFHDSSPVALGDLSVAVAGGLDKPAEALEMIELAMALCERTSKPEVTRCNVMGVGGAMGWHRTRPYADFLDDLEQGYQRALELGEFDQAGFMAGFELDMRFEVGTHLAVLARQAEEIARDLDRRGIKQMGEVSWCCREVCRELLGEVDDEDPLGGLSRLREAALTSRGAVATNIYTAFTNTAMAQLVLGDYAAALETSMRGMGEVAEVLFNSWIVPRMWLTHCVSLAALELLGPGPAEAGAVDLRAAEAHARKALKLLRGWAKSGPENYAHFAELALGARAAARGRFDVALDHLELAWVGARSHDCRWVEGVSAEFVAEVLYRQNRTLLVDGARRRAWDAYLAWGANAKLERMREQQPRLFLEPAKGRGTTAGREGAKTKNHTGVTPRLSSSTSQSLDLEVVLRSVGVITEELELDEVVRRVLEAALTCAGADSGLLLLERGGELRLVAVAKGEDGGVGGVEIFERWPRLEAVGDRAPASIINFVVRTGKAQVIDDASGDPRFFADPYVTSHGVKSLLVTPIVRKAMLGVLVLENRLRTHGFRPKTIETLALITSQAASTLDNARLYAALGRSEARWRSLVDGAPDIIALLDSSGQIVFVNRGELESDFLAAMGEDSRAQWDEAVREVLDTGEDRALEVEVEVGAGAGAIRWFSVRLASLEIVDEHDEESLSGSAVRRNVIVVATEVSARKRAEVERELLEKQLRQQQRLEALGTLASGVAHEINNPVQGIMNYADLIVSDLDDRDTVREFAGEITRESERVATIVRNLLAFSRQEREHAVEDAEVAALIRGTTSLIKAVLRKDQITLELDLPALRVRCRLQQVQQIIMNLVTNARDALNERYSSFDERKHIAIRAHAGPPGLVRITVEDEGGGIPPEVLEHIFDPFFTTKGRDKGTGLGLSVSHGIARENGGELSVETRLGEGTRFHLDLPAAP